MHEISHPNRPPPWTRVLSGLVNESRGVSFSFFYLFEAVVHQRAENLSHHQANADDQQVSADDPDGVDGAGPSRHVCRCSGRFG